MVVGYWDAQGWDALVAGDAFTQTAAVNEMIASEGTASNYTDYCLPLDYRPDPIQPDLSEPPTGDEHPDECVADFMFTSQSASNNYYGWSWSDDIGPAVQDYAFWADTGYSVNTQDLYMGTTLDWNSYRAEIDAGRPLVLVVDTDGDGGTDHFVTAIGYDVVDGEQRYGCYNTFNTDLHWYEFAEIASGQAWGIYGAITFEFFRIGPLVHEGYVIDDDMLGDSVGDGDGIVECAEIIELWVDVRNEGNSTAANVYAEITTSDPYASISYNDGSSYPPIYGGSTARSEEDFEIEVPATTPDGHVIHFDYDLTAPHGGPWSAPFSIPVVCNVPDIDVTPASLAVTLPPGQSTDRTLTVRNVGSRPLDFEISEQDTTPVSARLGPHARGGEEITLLKANAPANGQNAGSSPGVSALAAPAVAQSSGMLQMLAWVRYTDYDEEYANTLAAIREYFTDFTVTESDTLVPAVLAAELAGKHVLLLPNPEEASNDNLRAAGIAFRDTLQAWVSSGGFVLATAEWLNYQGFLRNAELLDALYSDTFNSGALPVEDPAHPLAAGLGPTVQAVSFLSTYTIGDPDVQPVVDGGFGDWAVAARDIGAGHVALIGYDYYEYNDDAARIIANAMQWARASAGVPWLSETPLVGAVPPSGSQAVIVTFDAAGLGLGTYTANLIIANNDPDENPLIVPVTLHVNRPPEVRGIDPDSGSGPTWVRTYFNTTWADPDGWRDLKQCYFHIGANPSVAGNVTLLYNRVKGKLWMLSDNGKAWIGGCAPGSGERIENSQAVLDCANCEVVFTLKTTLTFRWAIGFKPKFIGAKKTGLKCKDIHGARAKAEWVGTWTVE
jgi:hypothetical protein